MKTGLGILKKIRRFYANYNLFRFWWRKTLLGFDVANQFLQRVDKASMELILKNNGAVIGVNCDIETGLIFHNCMNYSNFHVGDGCHIGKDCFFDLKDKISIGNRVTISMRCTFITHIDVGTLLLKEKYKSSRKPIIISDNVYIGAGSLVNMGVLIHEKAIVGACSFVNKNIQEGTVVFGIPAKKASE